MNNTWRSIPASAGPAVQPLTCPACPLQAAPACPGTGPDTLQPGSVAATRTTAAGPALPDTAFPYAAVFLIVTGCVVLGGAVVYIRR